LPDFLLRKPGVSDRLFFRAALAMVLLLSAAVMQAQTRAAQVMAVTGTVTAIDSQGRERTLEKGADVHQGDRIMTGEGALVQIRMTDGGYISVRSATEMAIDRFNYDDKDAARSNVLLSLIRGGFRSITGLIGRVNPGAYSVRTTTATVGIRGTDHEPVLIPPGAQGGVAAGLYDKVNDGETFIRTERGQLSLLKGQIGFAPIAADRPPRALPVVPDFYKVEVKTDARDPKDAANVSKAGDGDKAADPGSLRPSLAARREALKSTVAPDATATPVAAGEKALSAAAIAPVSAQAAATLSSSAVAAGTLTKDVSAVLVSPAASVSPTTVVSPALSTSATTLISPALSSTVISPALSTSATTLVSPALSSTVMSPALSTSATTLITPALSSTVISPALSTTATMLVSPALSTSVIAPTAPISSTSTLNSTTLISPITTTIVRPVLVK
jgi:FecR protein